ncbi:MAG: hypothetical protein R3F02_18635 [Thiolinea sp.]
MSETEDIKIRLVRLEERSSVLERDHGRMWKSLGKMDEHLQQIQKTLNSIRWIATGMGLLWLFQTFGAEEILKKMIL